MGSYPSTAVVADACAPRPAAAHPFTRARTPRGGLRGAAGGLLSVALSVAPARTSRRRESGAPRRYLAVCPVEPGLFSSGHDARALPGAARLATVRPAATTRNIWPTAPRPAPDPV